jgi:hypothetical protein
MATPVFTGSPGLTLGSPEEDSKGMHLAGWLKLIPEAEQPPVLIDLGGLLEKGGQLFDAELAA